MKLFSLAGLFVLLFGFQTALAAPETTTPVAATTVQTNVATSAPGETTSIAPGETTTIPVDAEKMLLPSSRLYFWIKIKETIQLNLFTFKADSKAKLLDEFAGQRVKEMNYAAAINDQGALGTLLQTYSNQKNAAMEMVKTIKNEMIVNQIKEQALMQQQEMTRIQLRIGDETMKGKFVDMQKQTADRMQGMVEMVQGKEEAQKMFEQTRYTWVDPNFNFKEMMKDGGAMPTLPPNWEYRPYVDNAQTQSLREEMKDRIMSGKPMEGFRPPWEISPPMGGNYQPGSYQPGGPQPGGYQQPGGPQPGGYQQPGSPQPGGYQQPGGPQPGGYQQPGGSGYGDSTAPNSPQYVPNYQNPATPSYAGSTVAPSGGEQQNTGATTQPTPAPQSGTNTTYPAWQATTYPH